VQVELLARLRARVEALESQLAAADDNKP
jgi:BMFP domain-containing protein YqiC